MTQSATGEHQHGGLNNDYNAQKGPARNKRTLWAISGEPKAERATVPLTSAEEFKALRLAMSHRHQRDLLEGQGGF